MGFGTNIVTGDYSRGATGLWIENGQLDARGGRGHDCRQPRGDADERDRHRQRSGLSRRGGFAHAAHRRNDGRGSLSGRASAERISIAALRSQPTPRPRWRNLPQSSAVFALYGAEAHAEPYIGRTPNLRARLERLLQPSAKHPRRLQLAGRVRRIVWQLTGLRLRIAACYSLNLLEEVYGAKALERMHLRAPAFVRFLGGNPYPRITVTNRPSQREADWAYGPFASRAAAERYAEEALKLFLLRRCTDDLDPDPSHPGCVYSEMKMCLAPCYKGCTDERYSEEATAVESFLATRGESRLVTLRTERDQASANLEFESAAALHAQVQRVEQVRALASELGAPAEPVARRHSSGFGKSRRSGRLPL